MLIHPAVWPQQTWAKKWGLCFFLGGAGSPCNTTLPGPRPTSVPSGILINPAIWPQQTRAENWGLLSPPPFGAMGPHLTQCRLGRGLPYQVASWSNQLFGHNRHGPKIGGCATLGRGEPWSPSNAIWPGPRPTSMLSFTLMHPTVWPQYTNVTNRQTRQTDNGPIA